MIKALFWNCRGVGNYITQRTLFHAVLSHSDLIFLAEPKTNPTQLAPKQATGGFDILFVNSPPPSHHPTIWALAKTSSMLSFFLFNTSDQHLSILVSEAMVGVPCLLTGVYASNFQ